MTEPELIDKVLEDAKDCSAISVRSTPDDYHSALLTAKQYGLIEKPANGRSYCLTKSGRIAINLGGFEKWKEHEKQSNISRQSINIGGSVTGSQIGQDSHFKDLITDHKAVTALSAHEKQQDAKSPNKETWIMWIASIICAIIAGIILLFIEHKTGFFSGK